MAQKGILTTADYLPQSEYDRLLECLHEERLYVWEMFCRLAYCCQLRCSDVLGLTWKDVLHRDHFYWKERKTGKTRKIDLNESVQVKFKEMYEHMQKPSLNQPIIYHERKKCAYTSQRVNQKLKEFRYRYKLQIKNFSSHTFRKTFGRMVWEKAGKTDEALLWLRKIFNHSDMRVTEVYIGIQQDEIATVYQMIDFSA